MAVTITNEELDLLNKNGITDEDVKATVERYRGEGLDDNAIRQKVDVKLSALRGNVVVPELKDKKGNVVTPQNEEYVGEKIEGQVKKSEFRPASFAKSLGKGFVHGVSSLGTGLGKNIVNPLREKIGKKPLTDYEIENMYGSFLGLPEEGGAYKTGKVVGEIAPFMVLPEAKVAQLGTVGNATLTGAYQGALGSGLASVAEKGLDPKENLKDIAIGTVTGGALSGAIGKGGQIIAINQRAKNIAKRRKTPLADRMSEEQLARMTEPDIEPSNYGVADIDSAQNEAISKQIQGNISAEEELLREYKTVRADLVKKYGSVENLKAQAVKDLEQERDYGVVSNAIKDYRNLLAYEQELGNAKYVSTNIKPTSTREGVIVDNVSKPTKQHPSGNVELEPVQQPQAVQQADDVIPEQVVEATGKTKERGFVDTVRQNYGDEVANKITDKNYDVYTHEMQKSSWEAKTPEQKIQALNDLDDINPDVLYGKSQALEQAIKNGEPINSAMLDGVAKNLTKAGQEIEAAKHFIPTSPSGIVLEVVKQTRKNLPKNVLKLKDETSQVVGEALEALNKTKTRDEQLKAIEKILSKRTVKKREQKSLATKLLALHDNNGLNPENVTRLIDKHYGVKTIDVSDYAKIQELSDRFASAKTDRERDIATGLIKKFVWNKQPKSVADKAKTFRNMNMLLSIPSRTLDVASTAIFQGVNAVDELVAKGLDKITGAGVRSGVKSLNPKKWYEGVKRGYKEGVEDVNLGINTARSGEVDRYELGFHPLFEDNKILGAGEKALNYSIRVPDRMFYEARFGSAFNDLMATGKFTVEEAKEIARNEALQAVFQEKGLLSQSSKAVRDWIDNVTGEFKLGSHIAPFVQTPANLITEGLERSPLGLANSILNKGLRAKTPQQVREAQMLAAKGLTGTVGSTVGGGILLNNLENNIGSLSNEDKFGNDVTGLPAQSVVIGDKAVSLAALPYLTTPAGIGKALFEKDKPVPEKILNAITYTGNILSDIPMLKGLGDLYKGGTDLAKTSSDLVTGQSDVDDVLKSVGKTIGQQGANVLSQYIPLGGTLGTVRNAIDPYNREMMTHNDNIALGTLEYIGNRLQNRLPYFSKKLPMKYNVLGEPSMRNNIENDWLRGLESMFSPIRVRNYKEEPAEMKEMQRIQDYAMKNNIKGKTTLKFAKPKRYIGRGEDKTRLTNEQYSELTRLYNGKVYDELQFLMNTPEYQSQDEETKIKWVKEVLKEMKKEAEDELFDIME